MVKIVDSQTGYGLGTMLWHWLLAGIAVLLIWSGYEFMLLPRGPEKGAALATHLAVSWIAIPIVFLRVIWRLANPLPALTTGPMWQRRAARIAHWSLLLLIVSLAVTGYLAITSGRRPVDVFGLFVAPAIFGVNPTLHSLSEDIHTWLSHLFAAVLVMHILAALKRSIIDRDGTLRRMWP